MSDTLTIVGKVATDPTRSRTASGIPVTNFRLASTHRRFDNATQTWVDAGTNWYSVAAFRQLGEHAKASLRTGDSVIVTGRLKIRNWESGEKHGTSVDIDADAIGHDLRWGITTYLRSSRATSMEPSRGPVGTSGHDEASIEDEPALDDAALDDEASMDDSVPAGEDGEPIVLSTEWADTVDERAVSAPTY